MASRLQHEVALTFLILVLTPEGQRTHSFKMTDLVDHIVENVIQIGPDFISLESMKSIACVDKKTNKFEYKEVHIRPIQNC